MPTSRRNMLIVIAGIPALMLIGCSKTDTGENVIDPVKVRDGIKNACGILVVLASIAAILKLDPTLTISEAIKLVCAGFQAAKEGGKLGSSGAPLAGSKFSVTVKGKPVEVELE